MALNLITKSPQPPFIKGGQGRILRNCRTCNVYLPLSGGHNNCKCRQEAFFRNRKAVVPINAIPAPSSSSSLLCRSRNHSVKHSHRRPSGELKNFFFAELLDLFPGKAQSFFKDLCIIGPHWFPGMPHSPRGLAHLGKDSLHQ